MRCFIQSQHDLAVHRNTAYIRLATLSQPGCKEIISDIDELNIYEEAAAAMFPNQEEKKAAAFTSKMRLAAVRANPKKEKLAQDCFHVCVKRSDWDYAQQVCSDRKYFIGHYLASLIICSNVLQDLLQQICVHVLKICFKHAISSTDFILTECQIATVLEKNFPGNHEYPFWKLTAILTFTVSIYLSTYGNQ